MANDSESKMPGSRSENPMTGSSPGQKRKAPTPSSPARDVKRRAKHGNEEPTTPKGKQKELKIPRGRLAKIGGLLGSDSSDDDESPDEELDAKLVGVKSPYQRMVIRQGHKTQKIKDGKADCDWIVDNLMTNAVADTVLRAIGVCIHEAIKTGAHKIHGVAANTSVENMPAEVVLNNLISNVRALLNDFNQGMLETRTIVSPNIPKPVVAYGHLNQHVLSQLRRMVHEDYYYLENSVGEIVRKLRSGHYDPKVRRLYNEGFTSDRLPAEYAVKTPIRASGLLFADDKVAGEVSTKTECKAQDKGKKPESK